LDVTTYLRFLAALAVVLGLIAGLGWIARRRGWATALGATAAQRRLGVIETTAIDARHRLVLVRRDGVEHLLVIGPAGASTVETGITRGQEPQP